MRGRVLAAAALLAACAAPRPCTRTLCPGRLAGSYRITGWSGAVTIHPDAPKPPVPSDSTVEILSGEVEFAHGSAQLRASAGTLFRFEVSSTSTHAAAITVSSGSVSVSPASGPSVQVIPGATYVLPTAK